jgi:hypothetical protein
MKSKLTLILALLSVAILPVYAQVAGTWLASYGPKGEVLLSGSADQVYAVNHSGTGCEVKTVEPSDSSMKVTPSTGFLKLSSALVVNASLTSTTVACAAHSLVVTGAGSTATLNLPDATTCTGDFIVVVNNNTASAADTLTAYSSQDVGGGATLSLAAGKTALLFSDGANFQVATAITN